MNRPAYLELLKLGDRRREAGDYRGAAEAYTAVLRILPDNPAAMIALRAVHHDDFARGDR